MINRSIKLVARSAGKPIFKLLFESGGCSKFPAISSLCSSLLFLSILFFSATSAMAATGVATISGTEEEDQFLTANLSDADGTTTSTPTYQWTRNLVDIGTATNQTYLLTQDDVGETITVTIDYTDDFLNAESVTSVATGSIANVNDDPVGAPVITGTAIEDVTLGVDTSGITDEDGVGSIVSYLWKSGTDEVGTASTYLLVQTDVGQTMTVTVSYLDGEGTTETIISAASAIVDNVNDAPGGAVVITGTAIEDVTLGVDTSGITDEDGVGSIVSYLWKSGTNEVGTASTYLLVQTDVGQVMTVTVSYLDGEGTTETIISAASAIVDNVNDDPVGAPAITGIVTEGVALGVDASGISDEDGGVSGFSYLWKSGTTEVGTASTYLLVQTDVGQVMTVTVSYLDGGNTTEAIISPATAAVANVNDAPVGKPAITGTPAEGLTLGVDTSGISDEDGGVSGFSYLWKSGTTEVGMASTYLLLQTDVGQVMTVTVSYLDGGNTTETIISPATAVVVNVNDAPGGAVVISGSASEGSLLTAITSSITDEDGLSSFNYLWKSGSTEVGTASTYMVVQSDVNKTITVTVSYLDGGNTTETLISAATAIITNTNDAPVGFPVITGAATEDVTLGVDTSGITDEDGVGSFSYLWKSGTTEVGAASTYLLVQTDVGQAMTITVSYLDGGNTTETIISSATAGVANVNDDPSGTPVITGVVTEGVTLGVDTSGITDEDGVGSFTYLWKSGTTEVGTASTYLLVQTDVGQVMTVTVSYPDGEGTTETIISAATVGVANVNDAPGGAVVISGSVTEDSVLTAVTSSITDEDGLSSFSYLWKSGTTEVGTASTYLLVQTDVDQVMTVTVSYLDGGNTTETLISAATAGVANVNDVPGGAVTISGSVIEDSLLTAITSSITDEDGLSSFTYLWKSGATEVGAASTYLLAQTDVGKAMTVTVSYLDGGNKTETLVSLATAAVTNVNDIPSGLPIIVGEASEGTLLTVDTTGISDEDGLGPFSYQWKRGSTDLSTANSYTLLQSDVGGSLTVTVSYLDGGNKTETLISAATASVTNVNDQPGGSPVIVGTAQEDVTLTVNTASISDEDGLNTFSYEWKSGGSPVSSNAAYTLLQSDVGKTMTVTVSYLDGGQTTESLISAATASVSNVNDIPVGSPVITGQAKEGVTLGVNTSGISDEDGVGVFSFVWKRGVTTVSTNNNYILSQVDVGSTLTVTASYKDGGNKTESIISAATATVINVNDVPSGLPVITGAATEGVTLGVNTTGITDEDGLGVGGFSYLWKSGTTTVGNANTYTLVQTDVGNAMTVTVSYLDGGNTTEILNSVATANVVNVNDIPVGLPIIIGTIQEDVTLGVNTAGISDEDGLGPFDYVWKSGGSTVSTASTYKLLQTDVNKTMTVTVSYQDSFGKTEILTSLTTVAVANVNDNPSGTPIISGSVTQGGLLTADASSIADEDGLSGFGYQWKRSGSNTVLSTAISYRLVQADVGKTMTVTVSYVDGGGKTETLISASTNSVTNTNDAPSGLPTIGGVATQGNLLTANASAITDLDGLGSFSYQWLRNGGIIGGATSSSYRLVQADVSKTISIRISYNDGGGTDEAVVSVGTAAVVNINDVPTGSPVITGTASEGAALGVNVSAINDADGLGTFSYQWKRIGSNNVISTASSYVLLQVDVGSQLTVTVNYQDLGGKAETLTSAATATVTNVNDNPLGSPVITGIAREDVTLGVNVSAINDEDGLGAFSYIWKSGTTEVGTASTYLLVQSDVGNTMTVIVSYKDAGNTTETLISAATAIVTNVNDAPIGLPVIDGSVIQNSVLTANTSAITDEDGFGVGGFNYQWMRDGFVITGAMDSTYSLVQLDVDTFISVVVSYTDAGDKLESVTSVVTVAVDNVNDVPVGLPIISGSAVQGSLITVDTLSITDIDDLGPFSYQWLRAGVDIVGATEDTYTLAQEDVGEFVSVAVSYTDGGLTVETVISNQLGRVANVNDIGVVIIDGLATEGSTLKVVAVIDDDGAPDLVIDVDEFTFQWLRDGAAIVGADSINYILKEGIDLARTISVRVTYTDDFGFDEIVVSNGKGPIFADVPKVVPPSAVGPIDATGWFTFVDTDSASLATATDALDGQLIPFPDSNGQFRPGSNTVIWSAIDSAGNVGTATQIVEVRPLVGVSKGQLSTEGADVVVKVTLNGDALNYPVVIPYTVGGTASSTDHTLINGVINILQPAPMTLPEEVISLFIEVDSVAEGMETIIITLGSSPDAVLGLVSEHTVEVVEQNVAPIVILSSVQAGVGSAMKIDSGEGLVTITASATDANGDGLSYDWSGTDNSLTDTDLNTGNNRFTFDPDSSVTLPGIYIVRVAVSDQNIIVESSLVLQVLEGQLLASYLDSDSDGIIDMHDEITGGNVLQQKTTIINEFMMQTESGLKLSLGPVAFQANQSRSQVTEQEILDSSYGVNTPIDDIVNVGGYFDFIVSGLPIAGESVKIVIPQLAQLPRIPVYRKLTASGWQDFVKDDNNSVASAAGAEGYCPPPGDSAYQPGLSQGHWCVQLTIEDGGPNDLDRSANNSITDPGGVARFLTDVGVKSSGSGGAGNPFLPLLWLFIILCYRNNKRLAR